MPTQHEVKRLTNVYRDYRQDSATQQRWSRQNPGNRFILRERREAMQHWLERGQIWPLAGRRILDVGCGSGYVLASLLPMGASANLLHGVDLLPERITAAQRRFPACRFECTNAEELPYPDDHFDLVLAFTLFSSILDRRMARGVAEEMERVLGPEGAILWYDFRYNNPRNVHVQGMTRQGIASLFPDFRFHLRSITLLPLLARRLGPLTSLLYPALTRLPWLRTHYIGLLHKQGP